MEQKTLRGPRVEIVGNRSVIIDGCDGIIDYDDKHVMIRLGRMSVNITGSSLRLRALTETTAIIDGYIQAVQYS